MFLSMSVLCILHDLDSTTLGVEQATTFESQQGTVRQAHEAVLQQLPVHLELNDKLFASGVMRRHMLRGGVLQ